MTQLIEQVNIKVRSRVRAKKASVFLNYTNKLIFNVERLDEIKFLASPSNITKILFVLIDLKLIGFFKYCK